MRHLDDIAPVAIVEQSRGRSRDRWQSLYGFKCTSAVSYRTMVSDVADEPDAPRAQYVPDADVADEFCAIPRKKQPTWVRAAIVLLGDFEGDA